MSEAQTQRDHNYRLAQLIIIGMCVQLLVIGYIFYSGYQSRVSTVQTLRLGCERGKLDRADNADFQNAHKVYIDKVVLAQSVKEDVKRAAREAERTYIRTSADLTKRSKINCAKAFPKARLIP